MLAVRVVAALVPVAPPLSSVPVAMAIARPTTVSRAMPITMPPRLALPLPLSLCGPARVASQFLRRLQLLPLFLNQELPHRILLVVLQQQLLELLLFLERFFFFIPVAVPVVLRALRVVVVLPGHRQPLHAQHRLPVAVALVRVVVVAGLVSRMVDSHLAPEDIGAVEVVDGEDGAAAILILEPAEALGLARLLIARHLDEDGLAILREDDDDVAFGELKRDAAKVDPRRVTPVGVP
jgi:hypothetical protein